MNSLLLKSREYFASTVAFFGILALKTFIQISKFGSILGAGKIYIKNIDKSIQKSKLLSKLDLYWPIFLLNAKSTQSQLNADLLPDFLKQFGIQINKTFFEAGACDGIINSNTLYLENNGWSGILVEPNPYWHVNLKINRPKSKVVTKALAKEDNLILNLIDAENRQLSALSSKDSKDFHSNLRKGDLIQVNSISLEEVLKIFSGEAIGLFSLDIEGGELDLIKSIDFNKFQIQLICVEHNYRSQRYKIIDFLESKDFVLILKGYSGQDYWFLNKNLM